MAMAKYTEISGRVLLNNLMELLDLKKADLAKAYNCTVAQLQVLATKDESLSKTTMLGRQLIASYNICREQSGDGAGPLRATIEEVLGDAGVKFVKQSVGAASGINKSPKIR